MLKLERVEISGFKSFYEKVDLAFPGSVTAVVGPNGCGKSNICDAVAWALGEQSARILRGERMDDVIFNGSAKRRPLGMAEVILTLSTRNGNGSGNGHGEGRADAEPETLRIGRRVYREGQGEYFLNDKQVRLKDIQDRLFGTGLGVRAYSVIEQGRIDQVLSTKPQDRRRLIEEAAGITKYKLRKRLAEVKLEETKGNLLRLSDILSEIERNCASLKRQASRAARYKEKSEELRGKKATLARARHDRLLETAEEARQLREQRRDRETQAAAAVARAEAELETLRLASAGAVEERDRLRETVAALEAAIQRDDALLEGHRRAVTDLQARSETLKREESEVSAEQTRSAREVAELDERLERALTDARTRSLAREESDRKASEAAEALARLERELEGAREQALTAAGDRVAAHNARHDVDLEVSRVAASLERIEGSLGKTSRERAEREEDVDRATQEERRLSDEAAAAAHLVRETEADLARLANALTKTEEERGVQREALGAFEHRRAALVEIVGHRQSTVRSAREALTKAGIAGRGVFSERLRPAEGWLDAVDLLLGANLEALLASGNPIAAVEASRKLPALSLIRSDWTRDAEASAPEGALGGWEVALQNFRSLTPAERAALPPAAFVATLAEALRLSERFPTVTFVTPRRELVRGPLVRAVHGAPETSGVFGLKREIEDLERKATETRAKLHGLETGLEELRRTRTHRESEMSSIRQRERDAGATLSAFLARLEEKRSERDRLRREVETLGAEGEALREQEAQLQERRRVLEEQERRCAEKEGEIRGRIDTVASALSEARSLAAATAEELAHRRTEAEVAAERRRSVESARERLLEAVASLERRVGDTRQEQGRAVQRLEELTREEAEARRRRQENLKTREERVSALARAAETAEESVNCVERAQETVRSERGSLDAAREGRFEAEVAETRARADLEHLLAQAKEDFGVLPSELPAPADVSEQALAALEAETAELAASIEAMGPVNVLAFDEHREMSERLAFLSTQRDDLVKSIAELQESIRKINATSSERFQEAFTAINENFKAMFARLFQGGAAQMRLLDENDLLESGVEITAQPPGKRNQSILLLSGGEKALTAIALLMAIFRYKPSPFCILDEVDAPLDEANIDRFTRLLRDMTEETQFIAITHN
ncbi:MAG TPA: chromosome segregation protein SMC, partial [Thermoanaerobaculia bacterium]|nr:chromosome segregation protein SMC [Thermoanaerobaculia bacterium]